MQRRKRKRKKTSEAEEEPEDEEEIIQEESKEKHKRRPVRQSLERDTKVVKRRKKADGESDPETSADIAKKKKKKPPKKPTVFKKGKWNPDVELVEVHSHREDQSSDLMLECCIGCNNKNVIRAAITNNGKLLDNAMQNTKKISELTEPWSPELKWCSMEYLVFANRHDLLQ